jgi:hypothetical protein
MRVLHLPQINFIDQLVHRLERGFRHECLPNLPYRLRDFVLVSELSIFRQEQIGKAAYVLFTN